MNKVVNYLSVLAIFLAGYVLFSIKDVVHDLSYQLSETNRQIREEQSAINILKAESAFLQSPQRLKILAEKHLGLTSVKSEQMIADPLTISEEELSEKIVVKAERPHKILKHVNWRFKQSTRYSNIKTVSQKR